MSVPIVGTEWDNTRKTHARTKVIAMAKVVIGIHGLGNKPPEKILSKWWKLSLQEGMTAESLPAVNFKFALLYWAQFMHPLPQEPSEIVEPYLPAQRITNRLPSKLRRRLLDSLDKPLERLFLDGDLSDNVSAVSDILLRRYFKDLDVYFSRENLAGWDRPAKELITRQLWDVLHRYRKHDILLIAHSMGSIIAYDVLHSKPNSLSINTLVTIGSPLGIPFVIKKMKRRNDARGRPATPECITKSWYNLSDLEDKVCLDYALNDDYAANSAGVKVTDRIVTNDYENNGARNPHKSYEYLRTPEMAHIISAFLAGERGEFAYRAKRVWYAAINIMKRLNATKR